MPVASREAEFTQPQSLTISREEIYNGGAVVEYKIPRSAQACEFKGEGLTLRYLKSPYRLDQGWVGIHVHTADEELVGTTIRVRVQIFRRGVIGGKTFLYVDLIPVDENEPVTHWCAIRPENGQKPRDGSVVFKLEGGVRGYIALIPIPRDPARPKPKGKTEKVQAKKNTPPAPTPIRDGQLERLLAAGWQIWSETGRDVQLFRMKDGKRRTMKHCRPKR